MNSILTIQESFFDLYHKSKKVKDVNRYFDAINQWELKYNMTAPYKSYNSFKNAHCTWIKGKVVSIN